MCFLTKRSDQEEAVLEIFHNIIISFEISDVLPERKKFFFSFEKMEEEHHCWFPPLNSSGESFDKFPAHWM